MFPAFSDKEKAQNRITSNPIIPSLKRMNAITKLRSGMFQVEEPIASSSNTQELSLIPHVLEPRPSRDPAPPIRFGLTRTKTNIGPLKLFPADDEPKRKSEKMLEFSQKLSSSQSVANFIPDRRMTPLKILVESRTPGGTCNKARLLENLKQNQQKKLSNETTPPPSSSSSTLKRTNSGSMLLRQTPERQRRQDEIPQKIGFRRRALSETRLEKCRTSLNTDKIARKTGLSDDQLTEISLLTSSKRKRNNSTSQLCTTPTTPRRQRRSKSREIFDQKTDETEKLRRNNEKRRIEERQSPMKKRSKNFVDETNLTGNDTPIRRSPLKKNVFISTVSIQIEGKKIVHLSPMKKYKSMLTIKKEDEKKSEKKDVQIPKVVHCSSSGTSYYSARDWEMETKTPPNTEKEENEKKEEKKEEMTPLMKKQLSIDEKMLEEEDDEDEGFMDSTKTIKRGQGGQLARSLSLKLPAKEVETNGIKHEKEKSCSTPSLPTTSLQRQSSSLSLRFKVSPVMMTPTVTCTPICVDVCNVVQRRLEPTASSSPSTTTTTTTTPKNEEKSLKSALKMEKRGKEEKRRKKVCFDGVRVFYFDRKQGDSTVPSEGDVALDMDNLHHTKRYFPLGTGRRPALDLALSEDDELSEGEVVTPDSDDEMLDYEEFSSARSISPIKQKCRIKILKRSGVRIEKTLSSIDILRENRSNCGCHCENGVCLPQTCQCAIDGIQCQVDGDEEMKFPCSCYKETCTNPEGRIFYDVATVNDHRTRTIMNWKAQQKTGIEGSPVVKKFVVDDDQNEASSSLSINNSPIKYPVTPIHSKLNRAELLEIEESLSENQMMMDVERKMNEEQLENDVCVEEGEVEDDDEVDSVSDSMTTTTATTTTTSSSSSSSSSQNVDDSVDGTGIELNSLKKLRTLIV